MNEEIRREFKELKEKIAIKATKEDLAKLRKEMATKEELNDLRKSFKIFWEIYQKDMKEVKEKLEIFDFNTIMNRMDEIVSMLQTERQERVMISGAVDRHEEKIEELDERVIHLEKKSS